MELKKYLLNKSAKLKNPLSGVFELSPRCNMNCKMCYIRMTEEEMQPLGREFSAEEWCTIIDEAYDSGLLFLLFTGGEVFLRPDFPAIYEYAYKKGLVLQINTNGTLIGDEQVELMKKFPPERVNITLYGASDETYAELCGSCDGYSRVTRAIEKLTAAGIRVMINCSLTKGNATELDKIIDYCKKRDLILNIASYMFPSVRRGADAKVPQIRLSAKEAGEATASLDASDPKRLERKLAALRRIDENISSEPVECVKCAVNGTKCMAGKSSYWITWNGEIKGCGMFDDFVKYHKGCFSQLWESLTEKCASYDRCPECENCRKAPLCEVCTAINVCETGSYDKKPEFLCEMTDAYINALRRYSKLNTE